MAEYRGKQRNQLSKVISRSESKDVQLQRFADNRPRTDSQLNLIHSIQKKPNNTGLPDNLKSGVENLSGYSMDDVKVHYNSDKLAQLKALAYAQGVDIHVAPEQEKHSPHEVWHVAQQMAERVKPTTEVNGLLVNDNVALGHEFDVMETRAIQRKKNVDITYNFANKVIQRISEEDARQANFRVLGSAEKHGFGAERLVTIMQHRYNEIEVGDGRSMLLGNGTEEGYGVYGQILYNCILNRDGIYEITIYHAHGHGRMG